MILSSPAQLGILLLSLLILFLHFLHSQRKRREVAALVLWEKLPTLPETRAARLRARFDLLLLLQLLVLAFVAVALADPCLRTARPRLASLAIVLDGSASLRAQTAEGEDIAALVRAEALALLDRYPTTPVAVLEISRSPRVLAPLAERHDAARRAVAAWEPTWYGDGADEALAALLASQDSFFERVVVLTDAQAQFALPGLEVVAFAPGENVAISAFSVRESPDGTGPVAFVRVRNDTSAYREVSVRVSDGTRRLSYDALVEPGGEQALVLPFPASIGGTFTATLDGRDAFSVDDVRLSSLARRAGVRARVIGTMDRYLKTALTVAGVELVAQDDPGRADLVVCSSATLPAGLREERVLLVHATLAGILDVGEDVRDVRGPLTVEAPGDPLLLEVDPLNFVLKTSPAVRPIESGVTVLSADGVPILWHGAPAGRRVVSLFPDPLESNLPLTVDFPILVLNAVRWLLRTGGSAPEASAIVGAPVPVAPYGAPERLKDPAGHEIGLPADSIGFIAKAPGIYELTTSSGTYAVAANVDPEESPRPPAVAAEPAAQASGEEARRETAYIDLWPVAAALALCSLALESIERERSGSLRRRRR